MTDHFHGAENENPNHPIQKPVNPTSKTKTKNPTLSKVIRHPSLMKKWNKNHCLNILPRICGAFLYLKHAAKRNKFLDGPRSRWSDFKFVIKVCIEFIRGFRALHFSGPCVTIFGSARFKEDSPYYDLTEDLLLRWLNWVLRYSREVDQESWKRPLPLFANA